MKSVSFPNGLTVAELKSILSAWPDVDHLGEPTEVWIETGPGLSSQVRNVYVLNIRTCDDGSDTASILLEASP